MTLTFGERIDYQNKTAMQLKEPDTITKFGVKQYYIYGS